MNDRKNLQKFEKHIYLYFEKIKKELGVISHFNIEISISWKST